MIKSIIEDTMSKEDDKKKSMTVYTEEDKLHAVEAFFLTKSSVKASKLLKDEYAKDIPASTIRRWKQDKVTWEARIAEIKEDYDSRLDGKLTRIMEIASDKLLYAIEHGDRRMTPQGVMVNVPVPASELIRIQKQAHDQRNNLRGETDANSDKDKSPFDLNELGAAFAKHAVKEKTKDSTLLYDLTEKDINEDKKDVD